MKLIIIFIFNEDGATAEICLSIGDYQITLTI